MFDGHVKTFGVTPYMRVLNTRVSDLTPSSAWAGGGFESTYRRSVQKRNYFLSPAFRTIHVPEGETTYQHIAQQKLIEKRLITILERIEVNVFF
jgi:hypothetical protein